MLFRQIFDPKLAQYAYLIGCQKTKEAIIIDPERDIDQYVELAQKEGLKIVAVAETHIHADFLSGAREFAERFSTKLYLSDEGDENWKYEWVKGNKQDGAPYDAVLLRDQDVFKIGGVTSRLGGDPDDLTTRLDQPDALLDAGLGVEGVRGQHRLHADRVVAADRDLSHRHHAGAMALVAVGISTVVERGGIGHGNEPS